MLLLKTRRWEKTFLLGSLLFYLLLMLLLLCVLLLVQPSWLLLVSPLVLLQLHVRRVQ